MNVNALSHCNRFAQQQSKTNGGFSLLVSSNISSLTLGPSAKSNVTSRIVDSETVEASSVVIATLVSVDCTQIDLLGIE